MTAILPANKQTEKEFKKGLKQHAGNIKNSTEMKETEYMYHNGYDLIQIVSYHLIYNKESVICI